MNTITTLFPSRKTRIGFHYFPDTVHYRQTDLDTWIPELVRLKASWLILKAPVERAIPEFFIKGLLNAGVEPILQFDFSPDENPLTSNLSPLLKAYSQWGVKGVIFTDRPNDRSTWTAAKWTQTGLVERFLDNFLPIANLALKFGLVPILPPLQPGGNYWDTAFLRTLLEALVRRKQTRLLENLVLSAYSWTGNHPLNWGAGGPERWPNAKPYFTPKNTEDQRGFRVFDWYSAICQAVTGKLCPIILLGAGLPSNPYALQSNQNDENLQSNTNLAIWKLLMNEEANAEKNPEEKLAPIPEEVIACSFWLLASEPSSPLQEHAWFKSNGVKSESLKSVLKWLAEPRKKKISKSTVTKTFRKDFYKKIAKSSPPRPIKHYLLLPIYDWGVADFHLEVIQPFVKKYKPTIGFSIKEATLAERVTVIGGTQAFPEELLMKLRESGCSVERIAGDGTSIATQLSER